VKKNLETLLAGIDQGRTASGNILKYIKITFSSNFGNVFSVLVASVVLPFLPMRAIQLLVQNLLYDIAQVFLPWDRVDKSFRAHPQPWSAESIARFMLVFGPQFRFRPADLRRIVVRLRCEFPCQSAPLSNRLVHRRPGDSTPHRACHAHREGALATKPRDHARRHRHSVHALHRTRAALGSARSNPWLRSPARYLLPVGGLCRCSLSPHRPGRQTPLPAAHRKLAVNELRILSYFSRVWPYATMQQT
jgi:Cation transport ATPase